MKQPLTYGMLRHVAGMKIMVIPYNGSRAVWDEPDTANLRPCWTVTT